MNLKTIIQGIALLVAAVDLQAAELSYVVDADTAYASVLNQIKRDGIEIESASKDAGIRTAPVIEGRFKQTNTYMRLTLLPEANKFRVVVYGAWRMTPGSPWSSFKANEDKADSLVRKLKDELHW